MTSFMLRASAEITQKAEQELLKQGFNKEQIANQNNLAVQLVENFFAGEIVDRHTYDLLCQSLNLLTDSPSKKPENGNDADLDCFQQIDNETDGDLNSEITRDINLWNLKKF
jgi:hypothetical protein